MKREVGIGLDRTTRAQPAIGHLLALMGVGALFGYWTWEFILGSPAAQVQSGAWSNLQPGSVEAIILPTWPAVLMTSLLAIPVSRLTFHRQRQGFGRFLLACVLLCVASLCVGIMLSSAAQPLYNESGWLKTVIVAVSSVPEAIALAPILLLHPPGVAACVGAALACRYLSVALDRTVELFEKFVLGHRLTP